MDFRCGRVLLAGLLAGLALAASAPAAQDKPVACVGIAAQDPAGDQQIPVAATVAVPADDNMDLTALFFRNDGTKQTANAVFSDLDKAVPPYSNGLSYRFFYSMAGRPYFMQAYVDPLGAVSFFHGHIAESGETTDGPAHGAFIEGPGGMIVFELPDATGGAPDTKLTDAYVQAGMYAAYFLELTPDRAPDAGTVSFRGIPCPARQAPVPPRLEVRSVVPSARRATRTRRLTVVLRTSETLIGLRAKLLRGTRVVGTGRLARLERSGRLALILRGRVRPGRHRLTVAARRANGSAVTLRVTVRLR